MVELSAPDLDALADVLKQLNEHVVIDGQLNTVQITFPKGTARLDEINSFCFNNGIVLNHLIHEKETARSKIF